MTSGTQRPNRAHAEYLAMHAHSPSLGPSTRSDHTTFGEDGSFQSHFSLSSGLPSMGPHESATAMEPPSTSLQERSQKRPRNSSPVTPSKRRRVQHFPSTVSQRTPASTQISCTTTPLSGPRTRAQLDRYYEDVKRDVRRIIVVKDQLEILRPEVDADPQSTPEPTSESTPMTTKKAVKLLEKILKDDQLIEDLEEERKEVEPQRRGPQRSDTDGVVKHYRKKQQTRREKIRKDIRKARKRIGYNWSRLKAAEMVTEPEALPMNTAGTAKDTMSPRMSSPVVLVAVKKEGDEDSGEMADDSDSEPMLPTGRTVARSIMSPSVPPDHTVEEEDRSNTGNDEVETEKAGENGDAGTDASKDNQLVEKQAAQENESLSKTTRAPRRSIYTPDSVDEEDRPGQTRQEEASIHAAKEETETAPSAGEPADQTVEKTTNPINPSDVETQGKAPSRHSDDDTSDSGEDEDSSDDDDDDSSDAEVKLEDEDAEVKLEMFDDDSEDDDSGEDENSDVEFKVEMQDEEVKESSEDARNEGDKKDEEVTRDSQDQKKDSDESQDAIQSDHPDGPTSSKPTAGLFERMNGIQTSGSFEAMMAGLRQAAAERERQAVLKGQVVDSETSDSSDDESMPDWSPEPDAKPSIA